MQQTSPKPPLGLKSNKEHIPTCILKQDRIDRKRKSIAQMHTPKLHNLQKKNFRQKFYV